MRPRADFCSDHASGAYERVSPQPLPHGMALVPTIFNAALTEASIRSLLAAIYNDYSCGPHVRKTLQMPGNELERNVAAATGHNDS